MKHNWSNTCALTDAESFARHYNVSWRIVNEQVCFLRIIYSITGFVVAIMLFKMVSKKEAGVEEHLANIPRSAVEWSNGLMHDSWLI